MKRALFKLGNRFHIESRTAAEYFTVKIEVPEWQKDESSDWHFGFDVLEENIRQRHSGSAGLTLRSRPFTH
jgi:hypothetical protein